MSNEIKWNNTVNTVLSNGTKIYFNLNKLEEISGDDVVLKKELTDLLVKSLIEASNDFKFYQKEKDWEALKSISHKIKPNVYLLSNNKLLDKVSFIENNSTNLKSLMDMFDEINEVAEAFSKIASIIRKIH